LNSVIKAYAMCLIHGNEFIFQTMPRFLTLWLDYTNLPVVPDVERDRKIAAAMEMFREKTTASISAYCQSLISQCSSFLVGQSLCSAD
jgi:hypothetical protein